MSTTIWWIRRDLRLTDNPALAAALDAGEQVIPLFIADPALQRSRYVGEKRKTFLWAGLRELDGDLRRRGSKLSVDTGTPALVLAEMCKRAGCHTIFAEEDFSPYARQRDQSVADVLPLKLVSALTLHHPADILKGDGSPYTVYTPFSRMWRTLPQPHAADILLPPPAIPTPARSETGHEFDFSRVEDHVGFPAGEAEAQRRLAAFIDDSEPLIFRYGEERNRMDLEGTSQLSPYLRFGMLSARQAIVAALAAIDVAPDADSRKGADTWLNELIWREFYISILYHFPHVRRRSFRPQYDCIPWRNNENEFAAWCAGRTGYPVVDAAMQQLLATGWMHNRARMIVASFLVKDLLIDWRWGEQWFMQHLLDGDPAANNGGWQWTAGTGTDAAPYFRIFNPTTQSRNFDPDGNYIRRWLPELSYVPTQYVHEPASMPHSKQNDVGCVIGQDYPEPIVDHKLVRQLTLDAYARVRKS